VCRRRDEASFCAIIDGDGEVTDFLRLPHVMKRRGGWNRDDAELKVTNLSDWLLHSVSPTRYDLDFIKASMQSYAPCGFRGIIRVPTSLELSGNFVNLEKSENFRYGQGIFCDVSHGLRLAYR